MASNNPVKMVDPTGKYGYAVHHGLTYERVLHWVKVLAPDSYYGLDLAMNIADWDNYVDYGPLLQPVVSCGSCHFMPLLVTDVHVSAATDTGLPHFFGATLHQLQDYFAHWNEGYQDQFFGHGVHSVLAYTARDQMLLDDFFLGGHYFWGIWIPSFYPAHPREQVVQDIRSRNPGIVMGEIANDWELVDLYLRLAGGILKIV